MATCTATGPEASAAIERVNRFANVSTLEELARLMAPRVKTQEALNKERWGDAKPLADDTASALIDRISLTKEQAQKRQRREEQNKQAAEAARARAALDALKTALGARYAREFVRLEDYTIYDPRQRAALHRVQALAVNVRRLIEEATDVVFLGTVGTGKDHFMAHLLYRAADEGIPCRFVRGCDLFARFRGAMGDGAREREEQIMREFCAPRLLAISDPLPPSGALTDWEKKLFFRLIETRYSNKRPTWMTANATTAAAADAGFSEASWDRLQHSAEIINCDWQSYRERQAKARSAKTSAG